MPATRNRWLALGALVFAVAELLAGGGSLLRAVDEIHRNAAAGYAIGELLRTAAALGGAVGWLLAARALGSPQIDWRGLRFAATIVATTLGVAFAAVGLEFVVVLGYPAGTAYQVSYALTVVATLLLAVAAATAVRAFAPGADRVGERAPRLGRAGYAVAASYAVAAAGAVALESFYGPYSVPGGLPAGLAMQVAGSAVFALAAAFAGIALANGGRNREALLSSAAALGVAGLIVVAAGEATVAPTLSRLDYSNLAVAGAWLNVVYRAVATLALVCVFRAARTAAASTRAASAVRS
jgi:hypothetical protein